MITKRPFSTLTKNAIENNLLWAYLSFQWSWILRCLPLNWKIIVTFCLPETYFIYFFCQGQGIAAGV